MSAAVRLIAATSRIGSSRLPLRTRYSVPAQAYSMLARYQVSNQYYNHHHYSQDNEYLRHRSAGMAYLDSMRFMSTQVDHEKLPSNEPESKVEKTVKIIKAMKDEAKAGHLEDAGHKEEQKEVLLPLHKRLMTGAYWSHLWKVIKDEIHHYKVGFQLMWTDIRVATRLTFRVLNGYTLTRRERRQLIRTTSDMFLLVPFSVFIVVPFAELTLPFFIKFFPNMLPSQFQHTDTKEAKLRSELKIKLEMAKFLQQTVEEMAVQKKNPDEGKTSISELASFLERARSNNLTVSTAEILKFSKVFDNELTLDNLSRTQIVALCKLLLINSIGTTSFLRFQLRMKLRDLKTDDLLIAKEGLESLSVSELQTACRERGMRALGISEVDLKSRLQSWLDLHLKEEVPTSLLLLTRVMYLPDHLPDTDKLASIMSQLPDSAQADAKIAMMEAEGSRVDPATRLAAIKKEEIAIQQEQLEEAEEKAKESEKEKQEQLVDTLGDSGKITLEDLVDLAVAIIGTDNKADIKAVADLKEDVLEHKEDLAELSGESKDTLQAPKVSIHLSKRVEGMVHKLEEKLANLQDIDSRAVSPDGVLSADSEVRITTTELIDAMKKLKNPPSAAKLERIARVLDADADGVLSIDVITKVFHLVQAEGEDVKPEDLSILVKLIEKENILTVTDDEDDDKK